MYALDVLGVVTLMPGTRRGVLGTRVRRQRLGISTLLGAAAGSNFLGNSEVGFHEAIHMLFGGLGYLRCFQSLRKAHHRMMPCTYVRCVGIQTSSRVWASHQGRHTFDAGHGSSIGRPGQLPTAATRTRGNTATASSITACQAGCVTAACTSSARWGV